VRRIHRRARLRAYLVELAGIFPVTRIDGPVLLYQEPPGPK
jgi:hypothetical protein